MNFTVPGAPIPKARPRLGKGGHTYTPKRTQNYERKVQAYALQAQVKPQGGPLLMKIDFYLSSQRVADLDNLAKAVLDALNKVAYRDDNQVKELHLTKRLDARHPRAEVTIEAHRHQGGWA